MDPLRSKKNDRPLSGLFPTGQQTKMPILSGRQIYPESSHADNNGSRKSRSTRPAMSLTASTAPFFRTGKFQDRKFGLNLMQDQDGSSKFCLVRQNKRGKKDKGLLLFLNWKTACFYSKLFESISLKRHKYIAQQKLPFEKRI